MKFEIDIKNHIITDCPVYIFEVDINTLDFQKLEDEIVVFQKELNWNEMWDIKEVKNRLQTNWKFLIFQPIDKIKGWYWLDNTNEPRNLYINREYRNKGYGKEMQLEMINICKRLGLEKIQCYVDSWNYSSIKCINNAGWQETK